jgi:hypothetical protein
MAVRAVTQAYQLENGPMNSGNNNLLEGDRKSTSGPQGYQSRAEMVRDMQKPEYQNDPAFRQ